MVRFCELVTQMCLQGGQQIRFSHSPPSLKPRAIGSNNTHGLNYIGVSHKCDDGPHSLLGLDTAVHI